MESRPQTRTLLVAGLVALLFVMLFLPMAGRYGISAPWELSRATRALDLATSPGQSWFDIQTIEGEGDVAPLPLWLAAVGFSLLGPHESSGRIPAILLLGCALVFLVFTIRRLVHERAALFTAVVLLSFPLTGMTNMFIGGEGIVISILAFSLCGLALGRWWTYDPATGEHDGALATGPLRWVALGLGVFGMVAGYYAVGGLVGVLLPLLSAVLAGIMDGDWQYVLPARARERLAERGKVDAIVAGSLSLACIATCAVVVPVLLSKEPEFDLVAGGTPRVGLVPTFDYYLAHVAYGLYPWSGYLPMALAALLVPQVFPTSGPRIPGSPVRQFFLMANFLAFAAYSFFAFRYGKEPYAALVPAAVAVGALLWDLERADAGWRVVGFIGCGFVMLFFRDLHVYPESMAEAWAITGFTDAFPKESIARLAQAAVTGQFMMVTFFVFLQGSRELEPLRYTALVGHVRRAFEGWYGRKWKRGAIAIAAIWALLFVNAVLVIVGTHMTQTSGKLLIPFSLYWSLIKKMSLGLGFLPLLVLVADIGVRVAYNAVARARAYRLDMVMGATIFVAFYYVMSYMSGVNQNLSPRSAIETFIANAGPGESLVAFRTSGAVGRFYGHNESFEEISNQAELFKRMSGDERVWFFFKREEAPSLDLAYKETNHDHIPVVDARTWRFLLATNKPLPGMKSQNPISDLVRLAPPRPGFSVFANLDNKVEYLGYDLETRHMKPTADGSRDIWAGAMEKVTLTTYWHCTDRVNGSYQFFIHVDGFGLRLNGDHDVLQGEYPTRYWRPGDYLVDRFTMEVPIHFRPGSYSIYMGLFQGDNRLPQVSGPGQDDRILAGILTVK